MRAGTAPEGHRREAVPGGEVVDVLGLDADAYFRQQAIAWPTTHQRQCTAAPPTKAFLEGSDQIAACHGTASLCSHECSQRTVVDDLHQGQRAIKVLVIRHPHAGPVLGVFVAIQTAGTTRHGGRQLLLQGTVGQ